MIKNKTEYYKKHFKPSNASSIRQLGQMQDSLRNNIKISKQRYFSRLATKLTNNKVNPKCYWSVLKTFLNNKKTPCIPPLIHDNKFVTNFKEKNELFNSLFAKQCSLIETGSTLPSRMRTK